MSKCHKPAAPARADTVPEWLAWLRTFHADVCWRNNAAGSNHLSPFSFLTTTQALTLGCVCVCVVRSIKLLQLLLADGQLHERSKAHSRYILNSSWQHFTGTLRVFSMSTIDIDDSSVTFVPSRQRQLASSLALAGIPPQATRSARNYCSCCCCYFEKGNCSAGSKTTARWSFSSRIYRDLQGGFTLQMTNWYASCGSRTLAQSKCLAPPHVD